VDNILKNYGRSVQFIIMFQSCQFAEHIYDSHDNVGSSIFFFPEVKDLSGIATAIRCLTVCLVSLRSSLET